MSISNSVFSFNNHPGKGWRRKEAGIWICRYCNKDCITKHNLLEHYRSHPEYNQKSRNNKHKWCCEYCNNIFKTRKLLFKHHKECAEKLKLPHDKNGCILKPERHIKQVETLKRHLNEGKIVYWNKGKKNTPEHNAHIAEGTIRFLNKQLEEQGKILFPRVNTVGCAYIDELNKKYNWHLQHGLNGGEIHVGPYSVDGYDKELNIVFEYDEPRHYVDVMNNILTERDLNRMQYIKEQLHCRFFGYNEKLNLLYEC